MSLKLTESRSLGTGWLSSGWVAQETTNITRQKAGECYSGISDSARA